jgi:hypothetical protein
VTDKALSCVDCKQAFVFQDGEQKFFALKGMSDPKRCKPCRVKAKARRERSLPQSVRQGDVPYREESIHDVEEG